jgi:hypothetical protein
MFSKCEFWIHEVPFLGHMISPEGVTVDLGKVRDVLDWKLPTSAKCIVFLVGGLLSEVHFEFLQDLKAYHRAVGER